MRHLSICRPLGLFLVLAVVAVTSLLSAGRATSQTFEWESIPIGGGGRAIDTIVHPNVEGLVYSRSDVGGVYRLDPGSDRWVSVLDWIPTNAREAKGCDGLAIDPNPGREDVLYVALGRYPQGNITSADINGVWRSLDRGLSWKKIFTTVRTLPNLNGREYELSPYGGNAGKNDRFVNSCLAVDPYNPAVVYIGTRNNGLWRTVNGEDDTPAFSKIDSMSDGLLLSAHNGHPAGVRAVFPDPNAGSIDSNGAVRAKVVYAIARGNNPKSKKEPETVGGVYRSVDGGESFALLEGDDMPNHGYTMRIGHEGSLYVPTSKGIYVWKDEAWKCLPGTQGKHFVGMALRADELTGEDFIVAFTNKTSDLWRSQDSGNSWEQLGYGKVEVDQSNWQRLWKFAFAKPVAARFDPHNEGVLWTSDAFGPSRFEAVWSERPQVNALINGYEVTVILSVSPSSMDDRLVYASLGDIGGFALDSVDQPPREHIREGHPEIEHLHNSPQILELDNRPGTVLWVQSTSGSWSGNPKNGKPLIWISEDHAKTWRSVEVTTPDIESKWTSAGPAKLAVSSGDPNHAIFFGANRFPQYTRNLLSGGPVEWQSGKGVPADLLTSNRTFGSHKTVIKADPLNPERFYLMGQPRRGVRVVEYYLTKDGGENWSLVETNVKKPKSNFTSYLDPVQGDRVGSAGETVVFLSAGQEGLWRSADGKKFEQVGAGTLSYVMNFCVGPGRTEGSPSALYVVGGRQGAGGDQDGVFLSEDLGETFTKISPARGPVIGGGVVSAMVADPEAFGVVYFGTNGTGVVRASMSKDTADSVEPN